ncbi:dienelactone hydrolase family protein [Gammaproteobacteria bacterium]|jgi:carboxymethylenebutenolidase|nr:dienelactone hydrolase family protein [Gammaproteobacteria bacterium]
MDREISDLYDEYLHTTMGRRIFLQRLTVLAGGTTAAAAALTMLEGNTAQAAQVPEDDPTIDAEVITYPGATGEIKAYKVRPAGAGQLPAVIVIHANRGLWPHFKDVARKLALGGYLALAPDMLSPAGGTPEQGESRGPEGDAALEALSKIPSADVESNLVAAVNFLKSHPESTGKVGAIGFCWGGGHALSLAVNTPDLDAAVAYYGSQPQDGFAKIEAPMLLHYAADDPRLVKGIPPFVEQMEAHDKAYELYIYPGTRHAFNQDNRPDRYNAEAANLAWSRTLDFFAGHLA